jgi:uncharacterized protein
MHWFTFSSQDFSVAFLSVLFEGVPFLLLGSLISGLVDVFVSPERMANLLPKNGVAAVLISGLLGIVPICECGSVVVVRRFIRKGLPLSCAVTYMLAAPIVNPLVMISTLAAFRGQMAWEMALLRLSLGYLVAVGAGLVVRRIPIGAFLKPGVIEEPRKRTGLRFAAAPSASDEPRGFSDIASGASFPRKLLLSIQSATADFLDVAFFFIVGTAIASLVNTAINRDLILPFATHQFLAMLVLMGLAAIVALCSNTDAFIAASFGSFPPSAKLAFLLFGPVVDLKLFWLYGLIYKRRFVVLLSVSLFIVIAFLCWRVSFVIDPTGGSAH